jgi:hypothetical protein
VDDRSFELTVVFAGVFQVLALVVFHGASGIEFAMPSGSRAQLFAFLIRWGRPLLGLLFVLCDIAVAAVALRLSQRHRVALTAGVAVCVCLAIGAMYVSQLPLDSLLYQRIFGG